jgi:hypothetical protein
MTPSDKKHAEEIVTRLRQYDRLYLSEYGLSKEVRVFAAALYCVSLRETYPDGVTAFDKIAADAANYYDTKKK